MRVLVMAGGGKVGWRLVESSDLFQDMNGSMVAWKQEVFAKNGISCTYRNEKFSNNVMTEIYHQDTNFDGNIPLTPSVQMFV